MTDPLDTFHAFIAAVAARLEAGREAYGDKSFSKDAAELIGELEQESLDLAGWGYVLFVRLEAMRAALESEPEPFVQADGAHFHAPRGPSVPTEIGDGVSPIRAPGRVLVRPLLRQPDLTFAPCQALELARVPVAGEWVSLPAGAARVMGVVHLPAGAVDAELYLDPAAEVERAETKSLDEAIR